MLIDVQLDFERHKRIATSDDALARRAPSIGKKLRKVESHLGDIIREYENSSSLFAEGTPTLSSMPKLAEFIRPCQKQSPFARRFKRPFHKVLAQLRAAVST